MRFSDRITFVNIEESYYDPTKNGYVEGEEIRTTKPCNLSTLGLNRTQELFGNLDTRITVARLQRPYLNEFDHVLINEKKYTVTSKSDYRKGVFFLEGAF